MTFTDTSKQHAARIEAAKQSANRREARKAAIIAARKKHPSEWHK